MVATATAADVKARYPEFTGVTDELISAVVAEAANMVDDGWEVADQKPAIMALAAHLLAMDGWPARLTSSFSVETAGRELIARRVGDVSVQYAQGSGASSGSTFLTSLGTTTYGKRFAQLLKLNAPAIGVA